MDNVYHNPKYYDIAFAFRDIGAEIDVFEAVIQRYSRIPVRRMLEVGCGPAPHVQELTKRGYTYVGLDCNPIMLDYAKHKTQRYGTDTTFVPADMTHFSLDTQVDFAFILLGSLYVQNTAELQSHFDSVGRALKSGGLYLLDWCLIFTTAIHDDDAWEMVRNGIRVKATYHARATNLVEQTMQEVLTLDVDDHGMHRTLQEVAHRRAIYPQEFLLLMEHRPDFEFIGWWNQWDLTQPLTGTEVISRPITVIRKL